MSALRGKQHWQRVDADVRRTAAEVAAQQVAEREAHAANVRAARAALRPVDPATIRGAKFVKCNKGQWYEVVRVNAKTVSVATGYSWVDRIPHERIVEVRTGG